MWAKGRRKEGKSKRGGKLMEAPLKRERVEKGRKRRRVEGAAKGEREDMKREERKKKR